MSPPGRWLALAALKHRDFRLLWLSLLASAVGTWMQIVAQAVLVLDISHGSAFALGTVSLAQSVAFLTFALFGGAVADRVDKRRLLLVTQSLCMLFAVVLGVLTVLHLVAVWMVVVLAFLQGVALSFDQPSRAALVADLVPEDELLNAFSLQSIVFTGASTVGPALGGVLLAWSGYAANFFANAASYLGVLGVLLAIRAPPAGAPTRTPTPRAIGEALGAVRADAALPLLLALYGALLFFGPSSPLILPVMSRTVLHLDPRQLGLLFAATGAGTVAGGLALASSGDARHKGRIVVVSAIAWALAFTGFAFSHTFAPALASLALVGVFQVGVSATTITLLQTRVPRSMSGRVMSLNTLLIMGIRPLGDFAAAAAIARLGGPVATAASAAIVGAVALVVARQRAVLAA